MPRYSLNVRDGDVLQTSQGESLASLEAAREEALFCARRMIERMGFERRTIRDLRFEITDGTGKVLMVVPFAQALRQRRTRPERRWWRFG